MGRTAAGSELVKWMWLLMTVSGFPSYSTFTVTVKGMPAVVVDGATKSRVACVVPQPDVSVAESSGKSANPHDTENLR